MHRAGPEKDNKPHEKGTPVTLATLYARRPRRALRCPCGANATAGGLCTTHLTTTLGPTVYRPSKPQRAAA